jgi:hypothetical protein
LAENEITLKKEVVKARQETFAANERVVRAENELLCIKSDCTTWERRAKKLQSSDEALRKEKVELLKTLEELQESISTLTLTNKELQQNSKQALLLSSPRGGKSQSGFSGTVIKSISSINKDDEDAFFLKQHTGNMDIQENDPMYIHFRLTASSVRINLQNAIPEYDPYQESAVSIIELFHKIIKEKVPLHDWNTYLKQIFLNEYLQMNTLPNGMITW